VASGRREGGEGGGGGCGLRDRKEKGGKETLLNYERKEGRSRARSGRGKGKGGGELPLLRGERGKKKGKKELDSRYKMGIGKGGRNFSEFLPSTEKGCFSVRKSGKTGKGNKTVGEKKRDEPYSSIL